MIRLEEKRNDGFITAVIGFNILLLERGILDRRAAKIHKKRITISNI